MSALRGTLRAGILRGLSRRLHGGSRTLPTVRVGATRPALPARRQRLASRVHNRPAALRVSADDPDPCAKVLVRAKPRPPAGPDSRRPSAQASRDRSRRCAGRRAVASSPAAGTRLEPGARDRSPRCGRTEAAAVDCRDHSHAADPAASRTGSPGASRECGRGVFGVAQTARPQRRDRGRCHHDGGNREFAGTRASRCRRGRDPGLGRRTNALNHRLSPETRLVAQVRGH